MAKILREDDKDSLSTVNVSTQGGNLVESGHVALISVARDRDDGQAALHCPRRRHLRTSSLGGGIEHFVHVYGEIKHAFF